MGSGRDGREHCSPMTQSGNSGWLAGASSPLNPPRNRVRESLAKCVTQGQSIPVSLHIKPDETACFVVTGTRVGRTVGRRTTGLLSPTPTPSPPKPRLTGGGCRKGQAFFPFDAHRVRLGTPCHVWHTQGVANVPLRYLTAHTAGNLPGVNVAGPEAPMSPSMRSAIAKALDRLSRKALDDLRPYLVDADDFIDSAMAQIARKSGTDCGPIEASMVVQGALNHAYSLFYWALASADPANAKLVLMASKLGEAAKSMLSKALEMAVAISRGGQLPRVDPLDAIQVVSEPEPDAA